MLLLILLSLPLPLRVGLVILSYGLCRRGCLVYVPRLDGPRRQLGDLSTRHRLHGSPTSVASQRTFRKLHVWQARDARSRRGPDSLPS